MTVTKVTNDYNFYKEDTSYVVDFGDVRKADDKSVVLKFSDLDEAGLLELGATCGCTTTGKTLIDKSTATFKLSYTACDSNFTKVVKINYNNAQIAKILLRGRCRQ